MSNVTDHRERAYGLNVKMEQVLLERQETIRRIGGAKLLRNGFVVNDLDGFVQEVNVRVLENIHKVRDAAKAPAYIDTTARNLAKNWIRNRRETIRAEDIPEKVDPDTPLTILLRKERRELFYAALEMLDPIDRELILSVHIQEEPYAVVAERLGLKVTTARSRASRAVERVKKLIKQHGRALIAMAERKKGSKS